jgi:hypothetical protein
MPRQPSGFICPKISAGVLSCRDFPKRQIEPNTAIADLGALPSPPAQQAPVAQSTRGAFFHCRDHHFKERFFNYSLVFLLPHNGQVLNFGAGSVRFPFQRIREIEREPADCAPPVAALKFAQCYGLPFFHRVKICPYYSLQI